MHFITHCLDRPGALDTGSPTTTSTAYLADPPVHLVVLARSSRTTARR